MADTFPVLVLSLEDDVERRTPLLQSLGELGIAHELVPAVDGRKGLPSGMESQVDRPAAEAAVGRALSDGEFGCALSHRKMYAMVVERQWPGAVILEDDAIVGPDFARFMAEWSYLAAEMIMLDHGAGRFWPDAVPFLDNTKAYRIAVPTARTTGYSVSRKAAQHLLAGSPKVSGLADWPCDILPLGPIALYPRIVGRPPDLPENSHLYSTRRVLQQDRETGGIGRFATAGYWRRWWLKRRTITLR